jgi:hypothetical protein
MKLFSITVKLAATAYIKAESEEEAMSILEEEIGSGTTFPDIDEFVDGSDYSDSKYMPEFSLSPAMTSYGVFDSDETMELVDEFEEDDEEGEEED